jgi:hypothetical protein
MMSRREEILEEIELAIKEVEKFCLTKVGKYSEEDLKREDHLMGIDIIHDACHTLRGRLPKTFRVSLKAMKEKWKDV